MMRRIACWIVGAALLAPCAGCNDTPVEDAVDESYERIEERAREAESRAAIDERRRAQARAVLERHAEEAAEAEAEGHHEEAAEERAEGRAEAEAIRRGDRPVDGQRVGEHAEHVVP